MVATIFLNKEVKLPNLKIGVLRANALGDFILTLPCLETLRLNYPDAEIVVLGRKSHLDLFQGRIGPMDRIIPLPASIRFDRELENLALEDEEFLSELKDEKFDALIQLHGGGRFSNKFINFLNPGLSLGARTPDAEHLDLDLPYAQFQHEVIRQLEILNLLDLKILHFTPKINFSHQEFIEGRTYLKKILKGNLGKEVILINPGANDPKRRWPIEKFTELCRQLMKKKKHVLINIGPNEEHLGKYIMDECPAVNVIAPSLKHLTGILANCSQVISNDTGTYHLALAMNIPTVVLFWYRNLLNYGPLRSEKTKVLTAWGHDSENSMDSVIKEIQLEAVLQASEELSS